MESYEDPKDTSAAKVKTPGLEIQRFLMWESHVQCCAIRHDGVATRPSQTSNAESRDCSTLHIEADPRKCIAGASTPTTVTGSSAAPPSPLRPLPHPPRATTAPAEDFQRGVKRDIAHYEESGRDDQWDEWSRTFIATINTHGCKDVIDPKYVAATSDAQGLFDSQQEFVYTIFIKVLKTDYGRPLVRRHEIKRDSQRIWESLKLYCADSMVSIHRAQQLMKKINSFRIPETGRTKGIEAYLNEWLDYIREHDKLTTPIPDDTKLEINSSRITSDKSSSDSVDTRPLHSLLAAPDPFLSNSHPRS